MMKHSAMIVALSDDPIMARWDAGLVEVGQECPNCGEERMDWLVWDDDGELVTCETCGHSYVPPMV